MKKKIPNFSLFIFLFTLIPLFFILLYAGVWFFISMAPHFTKSPPKPIKNSGEFPYKIVYEMDGRQYLSQNTIVIEYKGVAVTHEKTNQWDRSLKYGKDVDLDGKVALVADGVSLYKEKMGDNNYKEVYFYLGSAEYYMGLSSSNNHIQPGDIVERYYSGKYEKVLSEEELYKKYGIKIIEKYISPPITE